MKSSNDWTNDHEQAVGKDIHADDQPHRKIPLHQAPYIFKQKLHQMLNSFQEWINQITAWDEITCLTDSSTWNQKHIPLFYQNSFGWLILKMLRCLSFNYRITQSNKHTLS